MLAIFRIACLIIVAARPTTSVYSVYKVEDKCLPGVKEITYRLGSTRESTSSVILKATSSSFNYSINCVINLEQNESVHGGVVLSVRKVNFSSPNTSCTDYIKIHQSSSLGLIELCRLIDDPSETLSYDNSPNQYIQYLATGGEYDWWEGFEVVATAYRNVPCTEEEFHCYNNKCVWIGLKRDGHNNCGDNSDEDHRMRDVYPRTSHQIPSEIFAIVVFGAVILILLLLMIVFCLRLQQRRTIHGRMVSETSGRNFAVSFQQGKVYLSPILSIKRTVTPNSLPNTKKTKASGISNPLYGSEI